jgi:hypothetical protein
MAIIFPSHPLGFLRGPRDRLLAHKTGPDGLWSNLWQEGLLEYPYLQQVTDNGFGSFFEKLKENSPRILRGIKKGPFDYRLLDVTKRKPSPALNPLV